jgi:hypothetical protein
VKLSRYGEKQKPTVGKRICAEEALGEEQNNQHRPVEAEEDVCHKR